MALINLCSDRSRIRGLSYYNRKLVSDFEKISDNEYTAIVKGNYNYSVYINTQHPRQCKCSCPYANGRKVCKHMIAVYYTIYPEEADTANHSIKMIKKEMESYFKKVEEEREERYKDIIKYVDQLTIDELKEKLIYYLMNEETHYDEEYEQYEEEYYDYYDEYDDGENEDY